MSLNYWRYSRVAYSLAAVLSDLRRSLYTVDDISGSICGISRVVFLPALISTILQVGNGQFEYAREQLYR